MEAKWAHTKVDHEVQQLSPGEQTRVLVSVRPGLNQEAIDLLTRAGGAITEFLPLVNVYVVELSPRALEMLAESSTILFISPAGPNGEYRNIVKALETIVRDRERSHVRVVNLSLGPLGRKPFAEYDPINLATRLAVENGIVVVVAAGNEGPQEKTLNPWSVAPWVIGVGAAVDEKTLADFSSRGDPENPAYQPTVVARGVDICYACGEPHIIQGTSFAAPKVAHIACWCIEFIETLQDHIDHINDNWSFTIGNPIIVAIIDTGVDPSHPAFSGRVGRRWRVLSQELREKLAALQGFLQSRAIPYHLTATPGNIKKMIKAMATPMPGRRPHEIGAGFVDVERAARYLKAFGAKDFVALFAERELTSSEEADLNHLDRDLGPLIPEQEIEAIGLFCQTSLGFYIVKVLS